MKSLSHQKGQHLVGNLQFVAVLAEEVCRDGQKLRSDFQLLVVAQAVEHEFLALSGLRETFR